MTTLLVSLTLDPERTDEVVRLLRGEMAPWMRRQPGFVSSHWYLAGDGGHCTITVEFDSEPAAEEVARATLALPGSRHRSWNVERVEVVDDLGLAPRPGLRVDH
ncbi:MAG TPA: antibiotic biosynthesis monooxygenase [Nocardioides sp.]|nr:antibiotic biosynthesis monooxygenase [Nocardioides sp.]